MIFKQSKVSQHWQENCNITELALEILPSLPSEVGEKVNSIDNKTWFVSCFSYSIFTFVEMFTLCSPENQQIHSRSCGRKFQKKPPKLSIVCFRIVITIRVIFSLYFFPVSVQHHRMGNSCSYYTFCLYYYMNILVTNTHWKIFFFQNCTYVL